MQTANINRQMFKKVQNQDIIEEKLTDGTIKRYVKGRLLGKGGFAKCYEFTSLQTQKKYAGKVIEKATLEKSKAKQKLTSQIKIHKSLAHDYVVKFQHFFEDAEYVYILLEKCTNQTLNQLLKRRKRLTDIQAKYYVRQLAEALVYLQKEKVIHRDLKLGNLFLSDKLEIKIGDFGLATRVNYEGERKKTKCGTPNYIAPEILDDKKSHSYQVDVWSMGVIAYTLLVGKPPFQTNDVKTTYNRIKTCSYTFPDSFEIDENWKKLISRMLQIDPSKRLTLSEIVNDPYLHPQSIPTSLPISSLACPPSSDFLKRFREKTLHEQYSSISIAKNNSLLKSVHVIPSDETKNKQDFEICKPTQNDKSLKKTMSRVQSTERILTSSNRAFSTTNLERKTPFMKSSVKKKNSDLMNKAAKIWVTYFEQNHKFGIGYMLNSNAVGFRYNDSTAMITNCKGNMMRYVPYDGVKKRMKDEESCLCKPEEMEKTEFKKYKILSHFEKDLKRKKSENEAKMSNEARIRIQSLKFRQNSQNQMKHYVTRYHQTNKSIVFWFSNLSVQVIFQDSSELLLNDHGIVTYVNKYGERAYFDEKDKDLQTEQIKNRILHLYSIIKGRKAKKSEFDNENSNKISINDDSNKMISRCASSNNIAPVKQSQTKAKVMKLKNSSSSSRLELSKKYSENR